MKNIKINSILFAGILIWVFTQVGCASFGKQMKSFLSGEPVQEQTNMAATPQKKMVRFSEDPNAGYKVARQYKRMTQKRIETESKVNSNAGSLWVGEGQGSYLFTQNIMRREGDILNVKLDGAPLKQVETKVKVIKKLIAKLEKAQQPRRLASEEAATSPKADGQEGKKVKGKGAQAQNQQAKGEQPGAQQPPAQPTEGENSLAEKNDPEPDGTVDIDYIPSRIVERMPDGNYRVKGSQAFMIGKREYKVMVTGIVRADDFNDEGLQASKMLDPQFDIVSLRKKPQQPGALL